MELLLEGAVVVLAALGLVEAVRMLVFWLLRPQSPGKGVLVVVPENGEDCEQLIRAGMARLKWMDWPGGAVAVPASGGRPPSPGYLQDFGAAVSPTVPLQTGRSGVSYNGR